MIEYHSGIKRNEITPCVATWVQLSEVSQKEKEYITFIWNLKYDTNKLIYETETDSKT